MTIKNSKVCVISDLHLGLYSNNTKWHEIAINWASWLRDDLVSKGITDIIFCGDWHHNRSEISVSTLQVSTNIFDILKDFNIIMIIGNHDIYYKNRCDVNSVSVFKGRNNIHIVDSMECIKAFGKNIAFCPWGTELESIPDSDIIFGHFEIVSFKISSSKVCDHGIDVPDILDKAKLVISGHFHLRNERKYKNGTILYCGNPFQMDFGDVGNSKGYYILDFETLKYKFYENKISPQYKKITLRELAEIGDITKEIKNIFAKNIVKFKIDCNITQEDLEFLVRKLSLLKPEQIITEYDNNINIVDDLISQKDLSTINIEVAIQEFVNILDIDNKDKVIKYTLDLYKSCSA